MFQFRETPFLFIACSEHWSMRVSSKNKAGTMFTRFSFLAIQYFQHDGYVETYRLVE
jgi:hypothetical protein